MKKISKFMLRISQEIKTLTYPTREYVKKETVFVMVASVILSAMIMLDTNGVTALISLVAEKIG